MTKKDFIWLGVRVIGLYWLPRERSRLSLGQQTNYLLGMPNDIS